MYFQVAKWGENDVWRYWVGAIITFGIGYMIVGSLPLTAVLMTTPGGTAIAMDGFAIDPEGLVEVAGSRNGAFVLIASLFVFTLAFFWFAVQFVHKKRMKWIATAAKNYRWHQYWFAFFIGTLVVVGSVLFSYYFGDGLIKFRFDAEQFGLLVLLAAILIPIQAGWEELFFRGYLLQGFGLMFKNRFAAFVVATILFAVVHMLNPEVFEHGVAVMLPLYLIMSMSFGIMVLMNDGLELAMGYHIANNFWIALLMTSPESVLQTESLFYAEEVQDFSGQILPLLVFNILVLAVFAWRYNWKENWKEKLFGAIQ